MEDKKNAEKERNRLYNEAINCVEQLISSTQDPDKRVKLGRIRYDLMAEWDLELHPSK